MSALTQRTSVNPFVLDFAVDPKSEVILCNVSACDHQSQDVLLRVGDYINFLFLTAFLLF